MTIEEKAKRYDEALKLARDYHEDKNCFEYLKGVLENIFSELAESEDERIRKELIDYINRLTASPNNIDKYNAWISWLEKQGEKKPTDKVESNFHE